jgi:hypothetical protein
MVIALKRHPHAGGFGLATLVLGLALAAVATAYILTRSDAQEAAAPVAAPVVAPALPAAVQVPAITAPAASFEPVTLYVFDNAADAARFDYLTASMTPPDAPYPPYGVGVLDGPNADLAMAELVRSSGAIGVEGAGFTVVDMR